jgi:ribonuclease PH
VLRELVAATSVGLVSNDAIALDLCYLEDSKAEVDLNVVATASGAIIELQGTAEGEPVARRRVDEMIDLALAGVAKLTRLQESALSGAGIDLSAITMKKGGK